MARLVSAIAPHPLTAQLPAGQLEAAPLRRHLAAIARRLRARYVTAPLTPRRSAEPLDGVIQTILSQQNTSGVARAQFAALRAAYPRWEAALLDGSDGIEGVLKAAGGGLGRVKAQYIYGALHHLQQTRGRLSLVALRQAPTAQAQATLQQLPGVGPNSAALVLLFDLMRPAMPVETHILRVSKRLELVAPTWNTTQAQR